LNWFRYEFDEYDLNRGWLDFEGLILELMRLRALSPQDKFWLELWEDYELRSSKHSRMSRLQHYLKFHPAPNKSLNAELPTAANGENIEPSV